MREHVLFCTECAAEQCFTAFFSFLFAYACVRVTRVRACGLIWICLFWIWLLPFSVGNLLPFVGLRGCYPFLVDNSDL